MDLLTVSDSTSTPGSHAPVDRLSSPERQQRRDLEYEEADEPAPVFEQVLEANVGIPNIPLPRSSDSNVSSQVQWSRLRITNYIQHWVMRLPNFVRMDSKPFHPETYVGPEHDDEDVHAETSVRERSMSIKLRVENTIRWKWTKDAKGKDVRPLVLHMERVTERLQIRKSNSRVIRWSDGSLSLLLGKEIFDITQTVDQSGAPPRPSKSQSHQPQSQSQSTPALKSQGLTYLVAQHKRAQIIQSEAIVTGTMSLRPTGMQSETHRMLVKAVGQKHSKVARLRMAATPTRDPERELQEEIKRDSRRPRKVRAIGAGDDEMDGFARKKRGAGGGGGGRKRRQRASMWSDDEDGEEAAYSDEEDEEGRSRSGSPKKKSKNAEGKRAGEYVADDFLVDDTDEEGGGDDSDNDGKRKRKRKAVDEQSEEDPLDAIEAKLAKQQQKERKQGKPSGEADSDGEGEMDVESEEEEEEFRVRRAGGGSKRKRAVDFDEDEDE